MTTQERVKLIEYEDFKAMYDIAEELHRRWQLADQRGDTKSKVLLGHAGSAVSLALDTCRIAASDGEAR